MSSVSLYHLETQLQLIVKGQYIKHKHFKKKSKQTKKPPKLNQPSKKTQLCLQTAGISIQIFLHYLQLFKNLHIDRHILY